MAGIYPWNVSHSQKQTKKKQTCLILVKSEKLDIFKKVFYVTINKKGESKADSYQKVSEKIKGYLMKAKNADKGLTLLITHSKYERTIKYPWQNT